MWLPGSSPDTPAATRTTDSSMSRKAAIIEQIGEGGLLLPELINRGLAANDRLQYYVTLLQAARSFAQTPDEPLPSLRLKREASGIGDATLDRIVQSSSAVGADML